MSEDMFRQDRLRQDAIKQAAIRQDPLRADLLQRELPTHDLPTHDLSAQDQAARQLATLNRIARIAVQDLALRPMLQRIVDTLSNEFDWEFVACASIDRARNEFVCEAVCSKLDSDVVVDYRRALGTGVVGTCAQTGQTIDIDDAADHPLVIDTLNGTGSELCVPVLHNGEVLAVLNAESRRVGAFLGQRAMLETVADQIAGILRAAHLLEDLAETNRRLHAANRALEAMAEQDGLTGIANRRCFDRWVLEGLETSDREGRPLGLLIADVDHFKAYNDGYGHLAGDACLREVATLLREALDGSGAQLARYGGEEFVVLLAGADDMRMLALAEGLRGVVESQAMDHAYACDGRVTLSIGAASRPAATPLGAQELIVAADIALYAAKRSGRNRAMLAPRI
jgi:diguanylate cyclase (GGDEF)-like protein